MKRLVKQGWELQGVEGKKIYNGMSWGGTGYILVKKPDARPSAPPTVIIQQVAAPAPPAPPTPSRPALPDELRIGSRVRNKTPTFRDQVGVVTKLSERSLTVKLDDGRTARFVPPNKVELLIEE